MSRNPWLPLLLRRYDMSRAVAYLQARGVKLFAWGICIPVTRDGGFVITWMRKEHQQ